MIFTGCRIHKSGSLYPYRLWECCSRWQSWTRCDADVWFSSSFWQRRLMWIFRRNLTTTNVRCHLADRTFRWKTNKRIVIIYATMRVYLSFMELFNTRPDWSLGVSIDRFDCRPRYFFPVVCHDSFLIGVHSTIRMSCTLIRNKRPSTFCMLHGVSSRSRTVTTKDVRKPSKKQKTTRAESFYFSTATKEQKNRKRQ